MVSVIVPAYNAGDRLYATLRGLAARPFWEELIVVDDGSRPPVSPEAIAAAAFRQGSRAGSSVRLVRLPVNRGKGRALMTGILESRGAWIVLLDADLGESAALAEALVRPLLAREAEHVVAVLPPAPGDGFGWLRRFSARAVWRRTGVWLKAPLSGQRAIAGAPLRRWAPALDVGYGAETMLNLLSLRDGIVPLEVPLPFDHRRLGRTPAAMWHRARQARDVLRALWAYDRRVRRSGGWGDG
ncbi:MAG: Glucosyl-3-phosphoglycerate synthase [Hydrogenibacillus schlegelii]|uniref:Glucosyl-3-phosphoglycerate synthase n=1 Tax=Hydrogenibacillus schlegelii TaxID=1484 RepID=A0A2T5GC23_HYDSH|nr:MAG: Glucosyl-3-phosphoglycerate synthase [Hydrogenibacillus schlegelii]